MGSTKTDFRVLIAELEADIELLRKLKKTNAKAFDRTREPESDELSWAALGYTIHNIYNLLENYFLRVSKFFENSLDGGARHRDLIERMTLSIEGLRPALLTREIAADIDELRSFRHVFRNIYQTSLDPERTRLVQERLGKALPAFEAAHSQFVAKIQAIADRLDE